MPTTYNSGLHVLFTLLFAIFGIIHFLIELCHGWGNKWANFVLIIGILGFLSLFYPNKPYYTFWALESVGFTGMIWFTPALTLLGDGKKRGRTRTAGRKQKKGCWWYIYVMLGSIAPTVYIISLPYINDFTEKPD